jgi:iron complex outermembrane recepter protein
MFRFSRLISLGSAFAFLASFAAAEDSASNEAPITMTEFTVSNSQDTGYRATNSISGTRLNQKLADVAQNIQVITSDFIRDLQASDLIDALQYSPGVVANSSGNENAVNVRGFDSLRPLRNGITTSGTLAIDAGIIDRIEVVKGPSSVLYGVAGVGGLVNYITKRPRENTSTEISGTYASFGKARGMLDFNQPLIAKKLLFRTVIIHERGKAYVGNGYNRNVIYTSALWNISPTTTLNANWENLSQFLNEARLNPQASSGPNYLSIMPRNFNWSGLSWRKNNVVNINLDLTQKFGSHWVGRALYNEHINDNMFMTTTPAARATAANKLTITDNYTGLNRFPNFTGRLEATGHYQFGGIESITLFGGERSYNRLTQLSDSQPPIVWDLADPTTWTYGDIYNLSKYTVPASRLDRTQQFKAGFITQQLAFFHGHVRATAGIRHDGYDVSVRNVATHADNKFHTTSNPPILSLLVKPIEPLSLYVLTSKSINTNVNQFDKDGKPFPPVFGKGIEAGAKFDFFDGRLSGSVATFRNERTNIPQTVLGSNPPYAELTGKERVDGTEENLIYSPTDSLQLLVGHTYLDGRLVADTNPANIGNWLARVSKNSYSLWSKYTFKSGELRNLALAGGIAYRSAFPTSTTVAANRTVLPAYATVDASVSYSKKIAQRNWSFALKVGNALARDYRNGNGVPQPLRTYSLSSSVRF